MQHIGGLLCETRARWPAHSNLRALSGSLVTKTATSSGVKEICTGWNFSKYGTNFTSNTPDSRPEEETRELVTESKIRFSTVKNTDRPFSTADHTSNSLAGVF
jgi:hypothetical protein